MPYPVDVGLANEIGHIGRIAPTIISIVFALKLVIVNDDAGTLAAMFQETMLSQTSPLLGEVLMVAAWTIYRKQLGDGGR